MRAEELESVPVKAGEASISAGSVARFTLENAPSSMARRERQDVLYLNPQSRPGTERLFSRAMSRARASHPAVRNVDESALRRYGKTLLATVGLVVILLYLVLGAQFESFSLPVILLTTIPLAIAGAGPALFLAGAGLDSGSVLGLVVLFGVAVNNAIVLYETSSARSMKGIAPVRAAYAGASDRVRPVLATSLTTLVSLLPIALSPVGAAQKSMALSMLGGLFASGGLTLFISPLIFAKYLGRKAQAATVAAASGEVSLPLDGLAPRESTPAPLAVAEVLP
jgi:multidrug efflux pump subunit AcrB